MLRTLVLAVHVAAGGAGLVLGPLAMGAAKAPGRHTRAGTAYLAGWWLARRRPAGWLPWHVRLVCGSYVSLVTALLVVDWSSPLAWVAPTIVGSPLIAVAAHRASKATALDGTAPKALA